MRANEELIKLASLDLLTIYKRMVDRGYELVNVDECCFTYRGYSKQEWAPKGVNLILPQKSTMNYRQCVACVGAISSERGKIQFNFHDKSLNAEQFMQFLNDVHAKMNGAKYYLLADNASIHKTATVKECSRLNGVPLIYLPPYAP